MNRIPVDFGLVVACLCVAISTPGCIFIPCPLLRSQVSDAPPNLEAAVAELREAADTAIADGLESPDFAAGQCGEEGPLFTFQFIGPFTWQYDYFDRASHAFVGRWIGNTSGDLPWFGPCNDRYWPAPLHCPDRVVTEVIAGDRYRVGDGAPILP